MKFHIQVRDHSLGDLENGIYQGKEGQESTENLVFFLETYLTGIVLYNY